MKRFVKVGVAALALAAVAPSFAEELEAEPVEEGAVGWTPIAFGIASPVQLPWGHCRWDVFGLDLGVLYYGAPKMYGLGVAGLAEYTKDVASGLEVAGLMNWNEKDVYGVRLSLGANLSAEGTMVYGFDAGAFAYRYDVWGIDMQFIGTFQQNNTGAEFSGLVNLTKAQSYGLQTCIGVNVAKVAYGCQVAGIFNMAEELHGAQVGVINYADNCEWGFQIGLVNIIMSNQLKVLPIVNAYF